MPPEQNIISVKIHLISDFGSDRSGHIYGLNLNISIETGDIYYVNVKAMNGAGAWSDVVSSKPIHVYGQNIPGTVYDGREVHKIDLMGQEQK